MTCAAIHNWLQDYDGWDDWEDRAGLMTEEDVNVEYDPCDESNRTYRRGSSYHGFEGNFTRSQARREDSGAYRDDGDYDKLESERTMYEEWRLLLIKHYSLMYKNRTLQCSVR